MSSHRCCWPCVRCRPDNTAPLSVSYRGWSSHSATPPSAARELVSQNKQGSMALGMVHLADEQKKESEARRPRCSSSFGEIGDRVAEIVVRGSKGCLLRPPPAENF